MNDYKLLFSEDYCPGQSVSKRTCEHYCFRCCFSSERWKRPETEHTTGRTKGGSCRIAGFDPAFRNTIRYLAEKGHASFMLKTQNYPRIITSKYTNKKTTKAPNCTSNQQKNQHLQLSTRFPCFFVVSNGVSRPFFFPTPPKKHGKNTPLHRGNTISAVGTWYVTFSSVSSSHPSRTGDRWVPRCLGDPG